MIRQLRSLDYKPLLKIFGISVAFTALLETIARRSFVAFVIFMFTGFVPFIYNCIIVCITLYAAAFFKRRRGVLTLVCAVWLTLVTISAILHTMRPSPLTAADFGIFFSCIEIMDSYLSHFEIVLSVLAAVAIIAAVIYSFIHSKIGLPSYRASGTRLGILLVVFGLFTLVGRATGIISIDFSTISNAYDEYGFAYCFTSTIFKNGIDKPKGYNKSNVEKIVGNLPPVTGTVPEEELPNIVFVQLESFFDIKYYNDYETVEDSVPNFTRLKKEYPSGKFDVPVFGGGTANTEFEVLTGMRVGSFSGGEIPYSTVLEEKTCESLPFILKKYGYTSTAIHNHTGTFYDRYKVYANLGFDRFIPSEYMTGITKTPVGWERDEILTRYIFDTLENTDGKDFVFAVSVQGHGGYPTYDENNFDLPLTLKNDDGSSQAYSVRYFANQLREMDVFIGELVERAESFDEKTVIVFYGDHLPALKLENDNLDYITTYQTEYVVYSNFDFDFSTGNTNTQIRSNQIGSEILRSLSINDGLVARVNQSRHSMKDYGSALKIIQYDVLFGENYSAACVPEGEAAYEATDIRLGLEDIVITDAVFDGSRFRVNCENSTYNSVIFINGERCDTKYISESILVCDNLDEVNSGDIIEVHQVSDTGIDLGSSKPHIMD